MHNFDFLIIGSGPAGQKAAIQASKRGKKSPLSIVEPMLVGFAFTQVQCLVKRCERPCSISAATASEDFMDRAIV